MEEWIALAAFISVMGLLGYGSCRNEKKRSKDCRHCVGYAAPSFYQAYRQDHPQVEQTNDGGRKQMP